MESTPDWAEEMMEKLEAVESRLDDIEESRTRLSDAEIRWSQNKFYVESMTAYHHKDVDKIIFMIKRFTPFLMQGGHMRNSFGHTFVHYVILWLSENVWRDDDIARWCMQLYMHTPQWVGDDGQLIHNLMRNANYILTKS